MKQPVDIIIPSCKPWPQVIDLAVEAQNTAGMEARVIATCQPGSAAHNRNWGLKKAKSPIRIMIDDDITGLPFGWARNLVQVLEQFAECEMVSASLLRPDGMPGPMMGYSVRSFGGLHVVDSPYLLSACIAFRDNGLRYDEEFVGSGWEDTDYCMQLRKLRPDCSIMVHEDVQVVHLNEMKNQAPHFQVNRRLFVSKWGLP